MKKIDYVQTGEKPLDGTRGWKSYAFEITGGEGRVFEGVVSVGNDAISRSQVRWHASYEGPNRWRILNGENRTAILHALATVDQALHECISQELNSFRTKGYGAGSTSAPRPADTDHLTVNTELTATETAPKPGDNRKEANSMKETEKETETNPLELAEQLQEEVEGGKSVDEVASGHERSSIWVRQHLALLKLVPKLQKLVKDGTIGSTFGWFLSRLPKEGQLATYEETLGTEKAEDKIAMIKAKLGVKPKQGIGRVPAPKAETTAPRRVTATRPVSQATDGEPTSSEIKKLSQSVASAASETNRLEIADETIQRAVGLIVQGTLLIARAKSNAGSEK